MNTADTEQTTMRSSEAGSSRAVLEVRSLSKTFGATVALNDAAISIGAGEVHIMLGENGAGKSTLAKIVAGLFPSDSGEIRIDGELVSPTDTKHARALGVSIIYQDLSLVPHLSVVENLFLGTEDGWIPFRAISRDKERERASEMLKELSLDLPLDLPVASLSVGEKQMLEIAKALLQRPKVLIADEPTAALTDHEKAAFFALIRKLRAKGTAILYVTHHLREVFEIGDRVSTMRDGRITDCVAVDASIDEAKLIEMLTGRRFAPGQTQTSRTACETLLDVWELETADGCRKISLTVGRGEIVGVYGVVGSGREALTRALVGLSPISGGNMHLDGRPYRPRNPVDARAKGVSYLAMDRKEDGILPERSIRENLTLSSIARHAHWGLVARWRENVATDAGLQRFNVRYGSREDAITVLSGGNQQKVLIARALCGNPNILVMEEPTAGIDIGAKLDIHESIRALAASGQTFLMISSDLIETLMLCDRVYTIYRGELTDEILNPSSEDEDRALAGVLGRGRSRQT